MNTDQPLPARLLESLRLLRLARFWRTGCGDAIDVTRELVTLERLLLVQGVTLTQPGVGTVIQKVPSGERLVLR